jgi:hypothetical protein
MARARDVETWAINQAERLGPDSSALQVCLHALGKRAAYAVRVWPASPLHQRCSALLFSAYLVGCCQEELLDALKENARMAVLLDHYRADQVQKLAQASKSECPLSSVDRARFSALGNHTELTHAHACAHIVSSRRVALHSRLIRLTLRPSPKGLFLGLF